VLLLCQTHCIAILRLQLPRRDKPRPPKEGDKLLDVRILCIIDGVSEKGRRPLGRWPFFNFLLCRGRIGFLYYVQKAVVGDYVILHSHNQDRQIVFVKKHFFDAVHSSVEFCERFAVWEIDFYVFYHFFG